MLGRALVLIAILAGAALAEAPSSSIRPAPRPADTAPAVQAQPAPAPAAAAEPATATLTKPKARPENLVVTLTAPVVTNTTTAPQRIVTPKPRPAGLVAAAASSSTAEAAPAKPSGKKGKKGSVCGDSAIRGEALSAIPGKYKGCGLAEPVRVTAVGDVALSPAATISCETAQALKEWIENGVEPAFGNRQVVELRVAASYICRTRNNKKGAKISEHGRGKAIDISAFIMADGTSWTVLNNYNSVMRKAHKAACGIFGTTLGPGSDGYHEDHLHFDTARYNSGPYCR